MYREGDSGSVELPNLDRLLGALAALPPSDAPELLVPFAQGLFARVSREYFLSFRLEDLVEGVKGMLAFLAEAPHDRFHIRVHRPDWLATARGDRWAIDVTGPDQPFLVDTLRELLRARSREILELLHPIFHIDRDQESRLTRVGPPEDGAPLVSFMHLETRGIADEDEARQLEVEADEVFRELTVAVRDFEAMTARLLSARDRLRERLIWLSDPVEREETSEVAEFLEWLVRGNFIFLGSHELRDEKPENGSDEPRLALVPGSGLGLSRDEVLARREEEARAILAADVPMQASRGLLGVFKSHVESRIVRRTRLDAVAVHVPGERGMPPAHYRWIGLLTARAFGELSSTVPVLRRKLAEILRRAKVVPGSHDHKEIFSIFCSLPKLQVLLHDVETLERLIFRIIDTRDRQGVRVHYDVAPDDRSVSVLVLFPRERFNAEVRQTIQELLVTAFGGTSIEYRLALTDEPLARLHFYLETPASASRPPIPELESRIGAITRTWEERVRSILLEAHEAGRGTFLADHFAAAFPGSYRAQESAESAASDCELLDEARRANAPKVRLRPGALPGDDESRSVTAIRIVRPGESFSLSRLMPTLTHLGLEVLNESTYPIQNAISPTLWLHVFHVLGPDGEPIDRGERSRNVEQTILAVLEGRTTDDALNGLVALAGLAYRDVELLRTYTAYLRQLEPAIQERTAYTTLLRYPQAARALVDLFSARFDPDRSPQERERDQANAREALELALESVSGIQEDGILRDLLGLVLATVRTNWAQRAEDGSLPPAISIKVRCEDVPRMPLPRPRFEIFVSSPDLEGIHLRSGLVARGGIRFSDRVDDFRREVLGLMKAQRTKNALIVPVGAKGGFILRPGRPERDLPEPGKYAYEIFIHSLLDVTDNIVRDPTTGAKHVVHPDRTVLYDDDDPYLVVAADKGTAQFSDLANAIAVSRSFWLGDAFASGGSTGYNHKEKGITARGAWECVKRHFLAIGMDLRKDEFTAVGIGDMSGDVFGNGMLLSRTLKLVAAFDHRHIFIDPDPDPEGSYRERERLFRLPRSSWDDYDRSVLSKGGGIYRRDSKAIDLSPEARRLLGIDNPRPNGNEVIRAILTAPVDLLWNGGIGTYIRASSELDRDVGDAANDAVRVAASDVRARVVGEGGNLGVTPLARVELARQGVLINTDFIDNSGGVDLSDHEVNLKVLLDVVVAEGKLTVEERNALIREVADEVCSDVVRDNRLQSDALSLEMARPGMLIHHRWLIAELESTGLLSRALEAIPSERQLDQLAEAGAGLVRSQLAVLLAYAKIDAYARVIESDAPDSPALAPYLDRYFPAVITDRFTEETRRHPLRREIIATAVINDCVNRHGVTFLHRVASEEGRSIGEVLRAWVRANSLVDGDGFFDAIDETHTTGALLPDDAIAARIAFADSVEEIVRWILLNDHQIDLDDERFRAVLLEARAIQTGPSLELEVTLPDPLERALSDAVRMRAALECATLAQRHAVSARVADIVLESAAERLFSFELAQEARRVRVSTIEDEVVRGRLLARLDRLRLRLASAILLGMSDDHQASPEARDRAASIRPSETAVVDIPRRARELVADDHPARRFVAARIARLPTSEPLTPSGLFVLVESLEHLLPR